MTPYTADEWKRRYAARLMTGGGLNERVAIECAAEAWRDALEYADPADGTMAAPEETADAEMGQWEHDGDEA